MIGAYIALLSGTDLCIRTRLPSIRITGLNGLGGPYPYYLKGDGPYYYNKGTLAVFISMGRSNESHSSGAGHLKSIGSIPSDAGTEPAIFGWEGDEDSA